MDSLAYFLEANIAFVLLYLIYRLSLKKGQHFDGQRIFLLLIAPLAAVLPLVELPTFNSGTIQVPNLNFMLAEVVVGVQEEANLFSEIKVEFLFIFFYFIFSAVLLSRICFSVVKIIQRVKRMPSEHSAGFRMIYDPEVILPYSFFYYIFLPPNQRHHTAILTHEMAHARQLHSADKLLVEILFALLWINPVVYFWRKSLEELHEYLADREVLRSGESAEDYSRSLVSAAYQQQGLQMASCFNRQFTKRRLIMLQNISKKQSSRLGLMFTLLFALVFAFSCAKNDEVINKTPPDTSTKKVEKVVNTNTEELVEIVEVTDEEFVDLSDKKIFRIVEQMPEYPGGHETLMSDLNTLLKYPEEAKKQNISGRVFVRFVVDEKGQTKKFKVLKSAHSSLNNAAIEAIKQLKTWEPGKSEGKAVAVWYTLPINFQLN